MQVSQRGLDGNQLQLVWQLPHHCCCYSCNSSNWCLLLVQLYQPQYMPEVMYWLQPVHAGGHVLAMPIHASRPVWHGQETFLLAAGRPPMDKVQVRATYQR